MWTWAQRCWRFSKLQKYFFPHCFQEFLPSCPISAKNDSKETFLRKTSPLRKCGSFLIGKTKKLFRFMSRTGNDLVLTETRFDGPDFLPVGGRRFRLEVNEGHTRRSKGHSTFYGGAALRPFRGIPKRLILSKTEYWSNELLAWSFLT